MRGPLTLVRGAPPNGAGRSPCGPPSDDPEARRRELMVVLELCAARARGARERAAPDRLLALVHASKGGAGTALGAVRQGRARRPEL